MVLLGESLVSELVRLENILKTAKVLFLFDSYLFARVLDVLSELFVREDERSLYFQLLFQGLLDLLALLSELLLELLPLCLGLLIHLNVGFSILPHVVKDVRFLSERHYLGLEMLYLEVF